MSDGLATELRAGIVDSPLYGHVRDSGSSDRYRLFDKSRYCQRHHSSITGSRGTLGRHFLRRWKFMTKL